MKIRSDWRLNGDFLIAAHVKIECGRMIETKSDQRKKQKKNFIHNPPSHETDSVVDVRKRRIVSEQFGKKRFGLGIMTGPKQIHSAFVE